MFLDGEFFKQSCANEFAFNMGIMMAAVWHLTGRVLVGANYRHLLLKKYKTSVIA